GSTTVTRPSRNRAAPTPPASAAITAGLPNERWSWGRQQCLDRARSIHLRGGPAHDSASHVQASPARTGCQATGARDSGLPTENWKRYDARVLPKCSRKGESVRTRLRVLGTVGEVVRVLLQGASKHPLSPGLQ